MWICLSMKQTQVNIMWMGQTCWDQKNMAADIEMRDLKTWWNWGKLFFPVCQNWKNMHWWFCLPKLEDALRHVAKIERYFLLIILPTIGKTCFPHGNLPTPSWILFISVRRTPMAFFSCCEALKTSFHPRGWNGLPSDNLTGCYGKWSFSTWFIRFI
jgi:hypothetical protein